MLTTRCPNCSGYSKVLRMFPAARWVPCPDCYGTGRTEPYEADPTVLCGACCGSGESYSGGRCFTCRGQGEVPNLPDEFTVESVAAWREQLAEEQADANA